MPDWPGAMTLATAAMYCDMSKAEFLRQVSAGVFPQPFQLGRSLHWSRAQLDKSIAVLFGDIEEDWRVGTPFERKY